MLATLMLGAKNIWNHDAFFDYVDRWMGGDVSGGGSAAGAFANQMWTQYRDALPAAPPAPMNCGGGGTGGSAGAGGSAAGSSGAGGTGGTTGGAAGATSSGGAGAAGGAGGSSGSSNAGTTGAGRGGASGASAGTSGSNGSAASPSAESDTGCGCRMQGSSRTGALIASLALVFAALARRARASRGRRPDQKS
jgi:hypothetical protein